MNGLAAPDELQINTVSLILQTQVLTDPNQRGTTKRNSEIKKLVPSAKKQKEQSEDTQNNPGNKNSGANNSIPNNTANNKNNISKKSNRAEKEPKTVYPHFETYGKTNHSTEKCYYGANTANRPPPGKDDRQDRIRSKKEPIQMTRMKLLRLQPKI